jgi:hypothetical protein
MVGVLSCSEAMVVSEMLPVEAMTSGCATTAARSRSLLVIVPVGLFVEIRRDLTSCQKFRPTQGSVLHSRYISPASKILPGDKAWSIRRRVLPLPVASHLRHRTVQRKQSRYLGSNIQSPFRFSMHMRPVYTVPPFSVPIVLSNSGYSYWIC